MWVKLLCLFMLAGAVMTSDDEIMKIEPSPMYQLPCMSAGGLCIQADECPEGKQSEVKGLCPLYSKGLECCFAVPKSSQCRANGGECIPADWRCPEFLLYERADDCEHGQQCCIWVK